MCRLDMARVERNMIDGMSSKTVQGPENAKNDSEAAESCFLPLPWKATRGNGTRANLPRDT